MGESESKAAVLVRHMDAREAIYSVERGYCLWVGAGLTVQLAGGPNHAPDWEGVTQQIENLAGLPHSKIANPERLEACSVALGEEVFRRVLRKTYYTDLSIVLLTAARRALDSGEIIPSQIRQIECLGRMANPIVSFNVEPFSSYILARPVGACRVVFYSGADRPAASWDEAADYFKRLVYHPHGLVTGRSTMTSSDYKNLRGGLALRLAVHAAYGNNLVIVGLSLEDKYLRDHLSKFRSNIKDIRWFDTKFSDEAVAWAARCNVTTITLNKWADFWTTLQEVLYAGQQETDLKKLDKGLCAAWYLALDQAHTEAEGGPATHLRRVLSKSTAGDFLADKVEMMREPGKSVLTPELEAVLADFSQYMIRNNYEIPGVSVTF